ncbi:uncharacterized protein LOC129589189 [Paramacrobiotus metropolitanus]|uniref:uncharacterized protein LOC129589189 n=1 Tax=Paramacrobiotus metropolitanus TaxID=2943436 RepID=UPI002445F950|nr:uncharacterized protein LOC129589189 [Paramacrobiotus metropolitanus]XP_055339736.1 uncharacterized protein LOC129589189 [Paramacrobiotus metropolitanus]XP_055339737.1 uncharacterized protein LOC129589189 [Paramacrobiotus metropolitanus]
MWWEILPSLGIITVAMITPVYATYYTHKLILGKYCKRRRMFVMQDKDLFDRDEDLTGFAYSTRGLDVIPDEPGQQIPGMTGANPRHRLAMSFPKNYN